MQKELLIRTQDIKPSREDFEVIGVFNPGCIRYDDQILLMVRIAERPIQRAKECVSIPLLKDNDELVIKKLRRDDPEYDFEDPRIIYNSTRSYLTSMSHLRLARSYDGINFKVDDSPLIMPSGKYEEYGIEDPRITYIDGVYNICYSCSSKYGILVGLIQTQDFIVFERKGYIFHPDNKDVAIFPQMIDGKYMALHRPSISEFGQRNIWIAESRDLKTWGNHKVVICPRKNKFDSSRVGASCVPFLTEYGWLEIYHGADDNNRYAMGAILLDRENPSIVLARTEEPIIEPSESFEVEGFFGNVVFGCGCYLDGDDIHVYYGAADQYVAKAKLSLNHVLDLLKRERT